MTPTRLCTSVLRLLGARSVTLALALLVSASTVNAALRTVAPTWLPVGTAIMDRSANLTGPDPFNTVDAYKNGLQNEYNVWVPENAMKMLRIHPRAGTNPEISVAADYDFVVMDEIAARARLLGYKLRGHTLLWHIDVPGWVKNGVGVWSSEKARNVMRSHIRMLVQRYGDVVSEWDVVNEAIESDGSIRSAGANSNAWRALVGNIYNDGAPEDDYIEFAFRETWQALRDYGFTARLFYNEYRNYNLVNGGGGNQDGEKSTGVYNLMQRLLAKGTPVDGIGWQAHLWENERWGASEQQNLNNLKALGLLFSITELDISIRVSDGTTSAEVSSQVAAYRNIIDFSVANADVLTSLITWGFTDAYSWVPAFDAGRGAALPFGSTISGSGTSATYDKKSVYFSIEAGLNAAPDTRAGIPSAPSNLNLSLSGSTVTLSWTDNSSEERGFHIERSTGTGAFQPLRYRPLNTTSFADTTATSGQTYTYRVRAYNAAGNSAWVEGTTTAAPGGGVVASAGGAFINTSIAAQTGTFTATFNATPSASPSNAIVALSNGSQTAFTGLAAAVRFNPSGRIDARNGGAYAAANVIPFSANTAYSFRLVVNVPAHTYSIYVTPSGGSELTVGTNYAFRTEQNTVTSLNNWVAVVDVAANGGAGTLSVSNFALGATPPGAPTFSPPPGTYNAPLWVTITCPGATSIRYTVDGSTPTTSSTLYTGQIWIDTSTTLKVIGVNSAGSSPVATGVYTIVIPSSATLTPVADSYAFGGATTTNYGTATVLGAKEDGTTATSFDRVAFVKFDLSGIGFTPTTATLVLTTDATTAAGTLTVNQCTTDSWTETGLTWANKPATGSVIGTATIAAAVVADKSINVSSYVNSQYTGDATKIVTFALTGNNAQLYLKSREAGATDAPTLVVGN